jgi:hypothetical protein
MKPTFLIVQIFITLSYFSVCAQPRSIHLNSLGFLPDQSKKFPSQLKIEEFRTPFLKSLSETGSYEGWLPHYPSQVLKTMRIVFIFYRIVFKKDKHRFFFDAHQINL